jgi:peptide/nickel transport system ATP-binding protein
MTFQPLIDVKNLSVTFMGRDKDVHAVREISFQVFPGEAIGFVGESGSGKSATARSLVQLTPEGARAKIEGEAIFDGVNLLSLTEKKISDIRGRQISMVFQDPMTSLNPVLGVGTQITDILLRHKDLSKKQARSRAIELLDLVGIRNPKARASDFPHEFSGGMRQRVTIAMAISCEPKLLIADEPTTALDVTVQSQILRLLGKLQNEFGMALLLITHDLAVTAGLVDRVYVMNQGEIVETGDVNEIFSNPQNAYTRSLLDSVPDLTVSKAAHAAKIAAGTSTLPNWEAGA